MNKRHKPDCYYGHNPGFYNKNSLVRSFIGFETELQQILDDLGRKETNQLMIIGPRGSGKTTLIFRILEKIRCSEWFQKNLYPVCFPEENYDISSLGEFWLKTLLEIGINTKNKEWVSSCINLKTEQNTLKLLQKSLTLLETVKRDLNRSILIVIENINQIFGQQLSFQETIEFNAFIRHTPGIKILVSASVPIEQIKPRDRVLFKHYKNIELQSFNIELCDLLYKTVFGNHTTLSRIKAIQILTKGNPRYFLDLSKYCFWGSFEGLQENLKFFVDQYTGYFKAQIDGLPSLERKVLSILAGFWKPAMAREIAANARIDVNKASACLQRLLSKGILTLAYQTGRKQWYEIKEPMFNIFLLVRAGQGTIPDRLKTIVWFMVQFYCTDHPAEKQNDFQDQIITDFPLKNFNTHDLSFLLKLERAAFSTDFKSQEQLLILEEIEQDILKEPHNSYGWCKLGLLLMNTPFREKDAENVLNKAIKIDPHSFFAWFGIGVLLGKNPERFSESRNAFEQALKIEPENTEAWFNFAVMLGKDPAGNKQAEDAYKKVLELRPDNHEAWNNLGNILSTHPHRFDDSHEAYLKAIQINPDDDRVWTNIGLLLSKNKTWVKQAEKAYKKAFELNPNASGAWIGLGVLQEITFDNPKKAIPYYKKAVELNPADTGLWLCLIECHLKAEDPIAAVNAGRKMVEIKKPSPDTLNKIAFCLSETENLLALEQAAAWIRSALHSNNGSPDYALTLCTILAKQGKWDESLDTSRQFALNKNFIEHNIIWVTHYYIEAAAKGYDKKIIEILDRDKQLFVLEPLLTGLKLFAGESCRTAREIREIGKDICEKIKQKGTAVEDGHLMMD